MNDLLIQSIAEISTLDELYEFICENDEAITKALLEGYKLPVFSGEDLSHFFHGTKIYPEDGITIVSYDDNDAIIVDGGVEEGCSYDMVPREDIEACVWCPFCNARSDIGNEGCEHLVVAYDAVNGDMYYYNGFESVIEEKLGHKPVGNVYIEDESDDEDDVCLESLFPELELLSDGQDGGCSGGGWRVDYGFLLSKTA